MKKQLLPTLTLTLLLLSMLTVNLAYAQGDPITLKVEPEEYEAFKKGETFKINITINDVEIDHRLVGVEFRLGYNDTLLEVLDVTEGPFMKDLEWNLHGTFFIYYIEPETVFPNGTVIPPHILVGTILFPNATGKWAAFPHGHGTLATITFKAIHQTVEPQPAANCTLDIFRTVAVDDSQTHLPVVEADGYYEIIPALYPIPTFTYYPLKPAVGQEVTFDATGSYDPDGEITWYYWEFADGATINTTNPTTTHIFEASGTHYVSLTVKDIDDLTSTTTQTVEIGAYTPLEIKIDTAPMYFRGEICEYYVLITHMGRTIDPDEVSATLYFKGNIHATLTGSMVKIATGFYRIPYTIPGTAEAGTYTLLVEAEYAEKKGMSMKSFYISDNLDAIKSKVDTIQQNVLTLITDTNTIKLDLTEIQATVTSIQGTTATISTNIGNIMTDIDLLNNSILALDNKIDDMNTTITTLHDKIQNMTIDISDLKTDIGGLKADVGDLKTDVGDLKTDIGGVKTDITNVATNVDGLHDKIESIQATQSSIMTILYATLTLAAVAAILAVMTLASARKARK